MSSSPSGAVYYSCLLACVSDFRVVAWILVFGKECEITMCVHNSCTTLYLLRIFFDFWADMLSLVLAGFATACGWRQVHLSGAFVLHSTADVRGRLQSYADQQRNEGLCCKAR